MRAAICLFPMIPEIVALACGSRSFQEMVSLPAPPGESPLTARSSTQRLLFICTTIALP